MANTVTAMNATLMEMRVQDYLTNILIAKEVARTQFVDGLSYGSAVEFPEVSDIYLETLANGTDLTEQPIVAASSQLLINTQKAALVGIYDTEKMQARADYQLAYARQLAYQLANDMDASVITAGTSTAGLTATVGTLDSSTMYQAMLDADTALFRNKAYGSGMQKFAIMGPKRRNLLAATFVANGYQAADNTLKNGFEGFANGFDVYVSNNIPSAVTLTMTTIPTAGDTYTQFGVTFTAAASGAATNAGDFSIGANAAAAQVNYRLLLNGTGTPGATTYIELSQENRSKLKNARATTGAYSSGFAITGLGFINGSDTATPADNAFGTETTSILFGVKGAIALGTQIQPKVETTPIPKGFGSYLKAMDLYGTKVFSRDAGRLYKLTCNQ